jgi:hypothetical protein
MFVVTPCDASRRGRPPMPADCFATPAQRRRRSLARLKRLCSSAWRGAKCRRLYSVTPLLPHSVTTQAFRSSYKSSQRKLTRVWWLVKSPRLFNECFPKFLAWQLGWPRVSGRQGARMNYDLVPMLRLRAEPDDCPLERVRNAMARARRSASGGPTSDRAGKAKAAGAASPASPLVCPECGKDFSRAASLGAHRNRAHGVAGSSSNARTRRATRGTGATSVSTRSGATGNRGTTGRGATSQRRRNGVVDRDGLLQALFPEGVPPRENVIHKLGAWLDQAEQLAKLRKGTRVREHGVLPRRHPDANRRSERVSSGPRPGRPTQRRACFSQSEKLPWDAGARRRLSRGRRSATPCLVASFGGTPGLAAPLGNHGSCGLTLDNSSGLR